MSARALSTSGSVILASFWNHVHHRSELSAKTCGGVFCRMIKETCRNRLMVVRIGRSIPTDSLGVVGMAGVACSGITGLVDMVFKGNSYARCGTPRESSSAAT